MFQNNIQRIKTGTVCRVTAMLLKWSPEGAPKGAAAPSAVKRAPSARIMNFPSLKPVVVRPAAGEAVDGTFDDE